MNFKPQKGMKTIKLFSAPLPQNIYSKHSPFVPGLDENLSLLCSASQPAQPQPHVPQTLLTHSLLIALWALGSGHTCRAWSLTKSCSQDGPAQHILPMLCPAAASAPSCPSPQGIPQYHTVKEQLARIQSASIDKQELETKQKNLIWTKIIL